jgi:hypothetical protein
MTREKQLTGETMSAFQPVAWEKAGRLFRRALFVPSMEQPA